MLRAGLKELELELFLRAREHGDIRWKTKSGNEIDIRKMSNTHLVNTINMIHRDLEREQEEEEMEIIYSELHGLHPNDLY